MALPENRIKKIKLPNNTEYTIVPEQLQNSGYELGAPTLTQNETIATESHVSGNYLPLSGGTLSGTLYINPTLSTHNSSLSVSELDIQEVAGNTVKYKINTIDRIYNNPLTHDETTYTYTYPNKSGTFAMTSDIPSVSLDITTGSESITVGSDSLNVVTRNTAQTISGEKTFTTAPIAKEMRFYKDASSPSGQYLSIANDNGYNSKIRMNGKGIMLTSGSVLPTTPKTGSNIESLGSSDYPWNDLYLNGGLRDGNNANYKLLLPSSTNWTANKTIATIEDIEALPEPMLFKGGATITKSGSTYTVSVTDPVSASDIKEGYTYKITSAPSSDTNFKVGDTLIASQDNPGTNPQSNWTLIPSGDEPSGTVTSVGLSMPTGFTVTGSPVTSTGTLTATLDSGYSLLNSNSTQTIAGHKIFSGESLFNYYVTFNNQVTFNSIIKSATDSMNFYVYDSADLTDYANAMNLMINLDSNSNFIGTSVVANGHFTAYGDDDNDNTNKPNDETSSSDLDTDYFNTGITLRGDETYKLSFPARSGVLGLEVEIDDLTGESGS